MTPYFILFFTCASFFPKGGQLALPVADGEEQDNHWPKEY